MAQSHWHLHLHRDPQPLPAMSAPYDDDDIDGAPMEDDLDGAPLMPDLNAMPPLQGPSGALFQPQPLPSLMSDLASHHAAPAAPVAKVLTPFEKAALLKQEKQAREDAEAAAEYAKFVQTFEADGSATQQQAGSRRGGARGPGNSALLKTTKFVSGGVMGGEAAAPTMIAPPSTFPAIPPPVPAPASGTFAPAATSPAMRPMDPITLKASLPSLSAMSPGLKPVPFLPVTAKPLPFELAASAPSSGAVAAFSQATSIPSVPMKKATPFNAFLTAAEDESASSMPVSNKKKPRAIDAFIEELRQRAEDKAAGKLVDPIASGAPGERPRDTGDATSTNIFARSLAPDVVENDLVAAFCPFGDIASVKIMWPRSDEAASWKKEAHQGFVSFMRRDDAEVAMREMHGAVIKGNQLKLNWSRGVVIPAVPYAYKVSPADAKAGKLRLTAPHGNMQAPLHPPSALESYLFPPDAIKYSISFPSDRAVRERIDLVAGYVAKFGIVFEQAMMERAHTDEPLSFLLSPPSSSPHTPSTLSPEHLYYRWRVYSLAQGETLTQYRQRPFQMVPTGAFWIPPDVNVLLREQEAKRKRRREAQEKEDEEKRKASKNSRSDAPGGKDRSSTRGKLSEHSAHTLMSLLRSVTMDRLAVRDVMGFCLDHSDASAEVVELLVDSLCLDETPLPKKIARFYVVSDILHNCTAPVPNASSYRSHFQSSLHRVFAALHRLHSSPALGRLSANALKEKVTAVMRAWERWALFPTNFVAVWKEVFEKGEQTTTTATQQQPMQI